MSEPVELKFKINAFTRDTIPMATLVAFLSDLAVILGEQSSVHFDRVEEGSAVPVMRVQSEAAPAVMKRARAARMNEGSVEALRAKQRIEKRLIDNNAEGAVLLDPDGAKILPFRGRGQAQEVYGPVRQTGELIGGITLIGGINDPVSVHLRDGDRNYVCEAKLDVAKRLRPLMFEGPVRVSGYGVYIRNDQGEWEMQRFRISDFERLDPAAFPEILEAMRQVKSRWLDSDDPLSAFRDAD